MSRLPIRTGTVVIYTRQTLYNGDGTVWKPQAAPRRAKVTGYDLFRSKYRLGVEYAPGLFDESGTWAFAHEVEPA
jgi:hypothetical protein